MYKENLYFWKYINLKSIICTLRNSYNRLGLGPVTRVQKWTHVIISTSSILLDTGPKPDPVITSIYSSIKRIVIPI